jgi:hypothetical protein
LVPGIGDALANIAGSAILVIAVQLNVPKIVLMRMGLNLAANALMAPFPSSVTFSPLGFEVTAKTPSCSSVMSEAIPDALAWMTGSSWRG